MYACARLSALLVALLVSTSCTQGGLGAAINKLRGDPYPLDEHSREASPDATCPELALSTYRGDTMRFQPAVKVAEPFVARLALFEGVVARVSTQVYGRAAHTIRHAGAYLCRPIRNRSARWSEHAFGNAIDVVGFDFTRADKKAATSDAAVEPAVEIPARLQRPFQVRVAKHWNAGESEADQLHQAFLRRLIEALDDDDVFRAMIGPADPNHRTHFHLDMGPWRYRRI